MNYSRTTAVVLLFVIKVCLVKPSAIQTPDCGYPDIPKNGFVTSPDKFTEGGKAYTSCNDGYKVVSGQEEITCSDGQWSSGVTCGLTDCGYPVAPVNGYVILPDKFTEGGKAKSYCKKGYVSKNDSEDVICEHGEWSGGVTCTIVDCGFPVTPSGGLIKLNSANMTKYGHKATVLCNDGFVLIGNATIYCGECGTWGPNYRCFKECEIPKAPAHGNVSNPDKTFEGGTAITSCNKGYEVESGQKTMKCVDGKWYGGVTCKAKATVTDCADLRTDYNKTDSGVYTVLVQPWKTKIKVYCDMKTSGGGWTVFQRRINGSVNFYRSFKEYDDGFGSPDGELWLGLKYIQSMTSSGKSEMRIDLTKADGSKGYEIYNDFKLFGLDYRLLYESAKGTLGDGGSDLSYHKTYPFSTYDRDRDSNRFVNCAKKAHGAWWYNSCALVNLNGQYLKPGTYSILGMKFYSWNKGYSQKESTMMFRKKT